MYLKLNSIACLLTVFLNCISCELSPDAIAVKKLLQSYANNVNASINLSRSDKNLIETWSDEFQIRRVNLTTKFRLQMARHKDHSFRRNYRNKKWIQCMDIYAAEINASEHSYIESESHCLRNVNAEEKDKNNAVEQVEREIKNWRRSYKYLLHLCSISHPNDEIKAEFCLVEYIEKDHYNSTLQRLMLIKSQAMNELLIRLTDSMAKLEDCLKHNLSSYLAMVRSVMEKLNRCYGGKQQVGS